MVCGEAGGDGPTAAEPYRRTGAHGKELPYAYTSLEKGMSSLPKSSDPSLRLQSYADPLRNFARQEFSKIIPLYEAKALFANIDNIIPASAAFSHDLEAMFAAGAGPSTVGDVCLKHVCCF